MMMMNRNNTMCLINFSWSEWSPRKMISHVYWLKMIDIYTGKLIYSFNFYCRCLNKIKFGSYMGCENIQEVNLIFTYTILNSFCCTGTEAEIQLPLKRSSRFQRLFPNPSWLVWGRASRHQKLAPTFPWIRQLPYWWLNGISRNGSVTMTKRVGPKMLLKVDCLPNAVGKQPSIPLIYLGRKWTLNWWWWWWWWCCGDNFST